MLAQNTIEQVIDSQKERFDQFETGLERAMKSYDRLRKFALIITGVRRCGKSTLMQQINKSLPGNTIYVNFEDPRLVGFDLTDFNRLHKISRDRETEIFLFDEIQIIDKWENFVRFALDEGYRVFITGSNAKMLSIELGTKLTGRHITRELFPFSYSEYLAFTDEKQGPESADSYMRTGGFPEMLKTEEQEVLMRVFQDIIIRDVAVRFGIRNTSSLQQLAVWLISNIGKPVTGNSLKKIFDIGSSSSIMDYISYFSDAYLFFFVPIFSYSHKVQMVNARKVYAIDTGLVRTNSRAFTRDEGRMLENMVFLQLRRLHQEIFYFKQKKECDFIVCEKGKPVALIQVCMDLGSDSLEREMAGIREAMEFFKMNRGLIITHNQEDIFSFGDQTINVIPFYKWAGACDDKSYKDRR